ncbi:hypothetical protein [Aquisphaera insulae]|uniref:hypothetical protein n=1 Tax=Aquisphaera insulae TaxID=2712864 RepID=UPI0013EBD1E1|nr:hypothetical protein [Aquisphaera insulae]
MRRSSLALVASFVAAVSILPGCGGDDMSHLKALSTYTPENVAQELLSRYRSIKQKSSPRAAEKKSKGQGIVVDGDKKPQHDDAPEGAHAHDSAPATKGQSVDDLIRNIAGKARKVEGMPRPEVLSKISTLIDADKDLSAADKDDLKSKLKQAMGD